MVPESPRPLGENAKAVLALWFLPEPRTRLATFGFQKVANVFSRIPFLDFHGPRD